MTQSGDTIQEQQILEKAIRGDRQALTYLVKRYTNMAYTIALKIVHNKEDAEEVMQDAFMKAFASLNKFNKTAKFSTWLYRIVYNTALTKRKCQPINHIGIESTLLQESLKTEAHVEWNDLQNQDRKKYVQQALSHLMPDDYLVVTLYYMGDKSIAEISEIMDKKTSAIKMQLLRARKQLEQELKRVLDEEIKDLL
ncbi:RNA polymerase sigma factor [Xanthocytophaga flava]|uniref:RNA polymerase sigma factor n=1 Tax=Xanthocytophaga flava TaxID=3048013 RepID=UPI0028D34D72|nr:RNA polymerase sigma factor [Xanthocytophaga flavus]MDJ1466821.1 RNA polymerase sigma factor [Xanthocytophaga flavus]